MKKDFNSAFVDTSLFIYFIEKHNEFGDISKDFFSHCFYNKIKIITSPITHLEFSVKPYRENKSFIVENFLKMINETGILISDINVNDCDLAAKLRAKYESLKNFDALQISKAINEKCDIFISNDKKLKSISEISIFTLDDWKTLSIKI